MTALFTIIKAIGLIMAVVGVAFAVVPERLVKLMPFFQVGRRVRIVGILRLAIAVIFLLAASQCSWPWVIGVLGVLILASGVLALTLKLKHIRAFLDWWQSRNILVLRIIGGVVVIVGLLIVFAA